MIEKIIKKKKEEIAKLKSKISIYDLEPNDKMLSNKKSLRRALKKDKGIGLIAEIKKASPSRGILRDDFNIQEIAEIYQKEKVNAISVLTEKDFFKGDLNYISLLKESTNLPLLQKDFFIDEYQIHYASYLGSDAILLIASILSKLQLSDFMSLAKELNMETLIEIHDENDLKKALPFKPEIIGINNRDLKTFKVDLKTTLKLAPLIPKKRGTLIVSESGISSYEDVALLYKNGVDAVLIGETFMKEKNISAKIRELKGFKV